MNTKSFKDFDIKPDYKSFPGKSIAVNEILNLEIKVIDYKIDPSKKKADTEYLTLDIEHNNTRRIVFSGSVILMQLIRKIPPDDFPFKTTIMLKDQRLEFT